MNTSEDERFSELAHKAIAKRAETQELAELQTMLEDPSLQRKFEMMKVEVALLKEALPLSEDIERQYVRIFDVPIERLRSEVRSVFEQRSRTQVRAVTQRSWTKVRLGRLLNQLRELVTSGRTESEREQGAELLAALTEFVLTRGSFEPETDAPELTTATPKLQADPPKLKAHASAEEISAGRPVAAGRQAWWDWYVKTGGAEADLQVKLMTMEDRLNNALTHLNNCKDEALTVLNLIREEKNALGRRVAEKIAEKREKGG